MIFAVNYYVGRQAIRPDQVEVFTGKSGVKVFRNPAALPRAWVVHEILTKPFDYQIGPLVESDNFDARRQTVLRGTAPELEASDEPDTVSLVDRQPGRVVLQADLKRRGMVIDADTFYPGWIATVDDKPARIYEAYGFLRGVVVDRGAHRIVLQYRPGPVYWGAALTGLGLLGAIVLRVLS
jgi:hypothetical protein